MKDSKNEEYSALISTAISLATNFGFSLPIDAQKFLASCAPVINQCINRVLRLFEKKTFAKIESARLGICYAQMAATVKQNLEAGHELSFPDLAPSEGAHTKADEIIEAIFKAAIDDSQTVKSLLYGHLMGNIPFQSQYDASASYLLLKTAMQLTYDELCMLAVLDKLSEKNYYNLEQEAGKGDAIASELFAYMLHINNLGLLKRVPAYTNGRSLDNHQISSLGHDLCRFLELKWLGVDDVKGMSTRLTPYLSDVFNPFRNKGR